MEENNRNGLETVSVAGTDAGAVRESERTGENGRGDQGDARRDRSDRRRRVKLRRRKRDSQSRDSDDTGDASANGADAGDAEDAEEHDEENHIRISQYSSESKKSSRKREKSESEKKAIKLEDAVEQFVDTAFSVVSVLSGEPHWALEPAERQMLGDAVVAYIEAQDKKTLQRLRKVAGKYFPAINLAVISFAIIYPRVMQSKIFLKQI